MADLKPASVRDYGWADARRDPGLEALSLTLVHPIDEAIVAKLAPRSGLPGLLTVAEALDAALSVDDYAWGSVLAQTDGLAGCSVIVEPNGWATSLPEVVARLSEAGRAVNVYWNVNAVMSFCFAAGGKVIRQFDPLVYDAGDHPLPEETDLPFGRQGHVRAASLALLERLTGARVNPTWLLERRRPTFIVPVPTEGG